MYLAPSTLAVLLTLIDKAAGSVSTRKIFAPGVVLANVF